MDLAAVRYQYVITQRVLQRNLEGVSHEQSLQRPASGANNLNWVLGHVAHARVGVVRLLGREAPAWEAPSSPWPSRTGDTWPNTRAARRGKSA